MQSLDILGQQFLFREFAPADQERARALILEGLGERWGWIDERANPDLDDIAHAYRDGWFLTLWAADLLVGTGGVNPEGEGVYRISRMAVRRTYRGAGLGESILDALVAWAVQHGGKRVVLETTTAWEDAVRFYRNCGFEMVDEDGENTHFELQLEKYKRPW